MTKTTTNTVSAPNLGHLHPSMREAVQKLIHQGKLVGCSHCHEYFARDLQHRTYCPACKRAGNTTPTTPVSSVTEPTVVATQDVTDAPRKARRSDAIHKRPLIACGNTECSRKLRDWAGRKYCSAVCKRRASVLAKAQPVVAPQAPQEPQKAKQEEPTPQLKGQYVAFAGAPCHREGCQGTFEVKTNSRNGHRFYGCSWFLDENRPPRTERCRATAIYAENVDGKTLFNSANPPSNQTKNTTDISQVILDNLKSLSADVRDCIGRVADLERIVTASSENVGKVRKDLSDVQFVVESLNEQLS